MLDTPRSSQVSQNWHKTPKRFLIKTWYLWKFLSSSETRWVLKTTLINSSRNHVIKRIYKQKALSHDENQEERRWSFGVYFWLCHWLTLIALKSQLTSPSFPFVKLKKKKITRWLRKWRLWKFSICVNKRHCKNVKSNSSSDGSRLILSRNYWYPPKPFVAGSYLYFWTFLLKFSKHFVFTYCHAS